MTIATLSETDIRIRDAVLQQLEWDPEVDASGVGVTAKDRVVALTGFIDTYSGKLAAERAAKRVRGVRAVANDIDVRLKLERTDADIARDAARSLELRSTIPDNVQAAVHNGYVTLTGKGHWMFQKVHAEKAVRHIRGVRGVFNHIDIAPIAAERDVRQRIIDALRRNADVNAGQITVGVEGEVAVLSGTVTTSFQREVAERAAANAPGITFVDNRIAIEPPDESDEQC